MPKTNSDSCGVYLVSDHKGRYYIGSSKGVNNRWKAHQRQFKSGEHGNQILQRAYTKYGPGCFTFRILELCAESDLLLNEQAYIDLLGFKPHYNITPTAGSSRGVKRTDEFKEKVRQARLGKTLSTESRKKLSEARMGMKFTEEHKENLSKNHKGMSGKKNSPETIAKRVGTRLANKLIKLEVK
jgi:group I intron endonuclease